MGIVADAVLQAGGRVIGVIPRMLIERELAHPNLTRQHVVATMHERKTLMAEMSDGFVGLPGGMGTFDELVEIVTWAQLGLHAKPVVLANIDNYFAPMYAMLDNAVVEGFVTAESRARWRNAESVRIRNANPYKRRACRRGNSLTCRCAGPRISRPLQEAGIAQLVEHDLAKVGVASSSLVSRSNSSRSSFFLDLWLGGRMVMQRPAKPSMPVRFRP